MMRLLKCLPGGDFKLISFNDDDPPPYAILSHTWTQGEEVTYNELVGGTGKDKSGYAKIGFCGRRAAVDGLEYFWVDTCCIDKSTSDELSTAINSMFRWYQRASKCYVYLADVSVPGVSGAAEAFQISWEEAFRRSRWFTRGWTLQELLAPASVEFFSKEGKRLGDRISLERKIHEITKIPVRVLRGQSLTEFSVEERMSWAAQRTTTLKEDKVYCLLGIFGVFLPLIYGEGEAYATLRLRDEIRKWQEGQGTESLHDLAVSSPLPFPRNEFFIGREDELQSLEQFLLLNTHQRITIYGLGGCGKSALALELAYRALAQHANRLVFWVPAISQESFNLAYREIGIRLHIPGITDDNADIKQLVKEALNSDSAGHWLMIVDNADDPGVLMGGAGGDSGSARLVDYLPYSNGGKIVLTTRSRKAAEDFTPRSVLELTDMGKAEARQLLARRITKQSLLNEGKAVNEMLELLAYLPLAIVQAAAFINKNEITVSAYISLLRQVGTGAELFGEHFEDPSRYREQDSTITKTWHISFDQIQRQDPLAAEYLSFIACIDRINIPQSLLPPRGSLVQQAKAIGTLKGYAFITERQQASQEPQNDHFFDMHRLVHMASEWWLDGHNQQKVWTAIAATRLKALIPYGGHEGKEVWMRYLPHGIHVSRFVGGLDDEIARASLLCRIGECQQTLGQFAEAEMTHRQELLLREKLLGEDDASTLSSMDHIGTALGRQGKYEEAESMHKQTLARREKILGPEHPDTLTSMSNLARVLEKKGKYEMAEAMNRHELAITEKVLGKEHPSTLTSRSLLARVLGRQGKYEAAESLDRQTLATREKVLGPEHPNTLVSRNNLAYALCQQGKYDEAEAMHKQVLAISEKVFGKEHPETLARLSNLALALSGQEKYEEAEAIYRQVLATWEKVLGKEHPSILMVMNNLASVLASQAKYEAAELMDKQTLAGREKVLGSEHPDTLMSMSGLAGVLDSQSKYEEAELVHRQMLATREKVLGAEHPSTLTTMNNLALVLDSQAKYEEAESMHRQTLGSSEKVLGVEHPDTLTTMNNLALVLGRQAKYEEAESMNRQTLAGRAKVLGSEHPDTLTTMNNLALMLDCQGKYEEAESIHRQTLASSEKVLGVEHPDTLTTVNNLALVLGRQGKHEEAESMKRQTLASLSIRTR